MLTRPSMTGIGDSLIVHLVPICWVGPFALVFSSILGLLWQETRLWAITALCLYAAMRFTSDNFDLLSDSIQESLRTYFHSALIAYFPMDYLTPSVVIAAEQWKRPQVILSGPHGVYALGCIRTLLATPPKHKNLAAVVAPIMAHTWSHAMFRMTGLDGMIPLSHTAIQREMRRNAHRDLVVIPGGFIETNTGNEHFSTMADVTWDYWLLQCLRHGYDVSFQWIHGATQIYHTGKGGMRIRLMMAKLGLPCLVPGNVLARNEVPLSVCSFRLPVHHVPGATRNSPEFHALVGEFRTRVGSLLTLYPHNLSKGQAPVVMASSL